MEITKHKIASLLQKVCALKRNFIYIPFITLYFKPMLQTLFPKTTPLIFRMGNK